MRQKSGLTRSHRRTAQGWLDRALVRLGVRDPLLPPRDLKFVGSGDFRAIGREFLRHLIELAELRPWHAILDVGCGVGRMAVPLTGYLNRSACYHGFDIVPEAIAWCRKQITPWFPHFHFQLADVYNPLYNPAGRCPAEEFSFPYADDTFDVVLLASVFTHLLPAAVERYLAEVARVLKPGGRCLSTFFLLNPVAQGLLADGAGRLRFPHRTDGVQTRNAACPEEAVAYDEAAVRRHFARAGLPIAGPIRYGSWSGRAGYLSFQDLVIARKGARCDLDSATASKFDPLGAVAMSASVNLADSWEDLEATAEKAR